MEEAAAATNYGLFDVVDKCWLGKRDEAGPLSYDNEDTARAAATVATKMFEFRLGRIRALPLIGDKFILKDSVDAIHTGVEAIQLLEGNQQEEQQQ